MAFITMHGNRWSKTSITEPYPKKPASSLLTNNCPVTQELNKLLSRMDVKRKGVSVYALRHTSAPSATKRWTITGRPLDHGPRGRVAWRTRPLLRSSIKDERVRR